MPCYLFTWHAYGTWMPDRKRGYVENQTVLPQNAEVAARYRKRQRETTARFERNTQLGLLDELRITSCFRRFRLHGVATDESHLHVLVSWRDERPFETLRRGIRESLTRRLNREAKRRWLSHCGSRKRVNDRKHFDHLVLTYLPSHRGVCWFETEATE